MGSCPLHVENADGTISALLFGGRGRVFFSLFQTPSILEREIKVQSILSTVKVLSAAAALENRERISRLAPLINDSQELAGVLFAKFFKKDTHESLQKAALEVLTSQLIFVLR
jgi:hypothetical protein